jgi:hypothetical protein
MNFDNFDFAALQRDLDEYARELAARNWWQRNWRWFVPTLAGVLLVLGAIAAFWGLYLRVYQLDVYRSAMRQIQADETLQDELGQPIRKAGWRPPSARIEDDETDIRWNIAGPKQAAKAHVAARLMQDKWEIVQLEVTLPSGERHAVASDGEGNAPAFTPNGQSRPTDQSREPDAGHGDPDLEIHLPMPTGEGTPQ